MIAVENSTLYKYRKDRLYYGRSKTETQDSPNGSSSKDGSANQCQKKGQQPYNLDTCLKTVKISKEGEEIQWGIE